MTDILSSSSHMNVSNDMDERAVAKAALDAAEEQLKSLCASHAGTFVSVERRGQALERSLQDLQASIKKIEPQVSISKQVLEQDDDKHTSLAALSERHRVRRRTLLQHSSLLELLELPSLMDACVRSNLYEEALSVAAFANTLERRHTEKNAVVARVIAQIRSRQSDLRRHLLHRLKSHVTMPQCLEVVTALRRLNSIDLERVQSETNLERVHSAMELRLQVDFLEARDAWLDSTTTANTTGSRAKMTLQNTSEQLLDAIERYRTRVFEIATQYNAIFRAQTHHTKETPSISLLSMWTSRKVQAFLSMLALHLNRMEDSASLRDALEAAVFFATSMGRLGADFTAQLPALFEPKMLELVEHFWKEGTQHLADTLKVCRDAGVASPLVSHTAIADHSSAATDGGASPPRQLLALPPLARLVNAILAGLNELRRCLFPGIFSQLRDLMDEILEQAGSILRANERAVLAPGLRGEAQELREVAARMKEVYATTVDPYLRGALEFALGNEAAAQLHLDKLKPVEKEIEEPQEEIVEEEQGVDEDADAEEGETGATIVDEDTADEVAIDDGEEQLHEEAIDEKFDSDDLDLES